MYIQKQSFTINVKDCSYCLFSAKLSTLFQIIYFLQLYIGLSYKKLSSRNQSNNLSKSSAKSSNLATIFFGLFFNIRLRAKERVTAIALAQSFFLFLIYPLLR